MTDIARLYELQKVDTTWEKVRRRLGQVRAQLVESDELKKQRAAVAELETTKHQWQTSQRNADLEMQALTSKINASEARLMSGQVRNPKELSALQESVEALRRQRAGVENSGVEALLNVEATTEQLAIATATLHEVEGKWQAGQSDLLEEETKLKKYFVQCKKQREALAAALAGSDLQRYEDLRQRKAGVAIASLERGICSACHVQVPTGIASTARNQSGSPVSCPSCGRILYAG
jgi:predicted  nucleic acid-binding Zn-ribbon protein